MADQIETFRVETFKAGIEHLAQQEHTIWRPVARHEGLGKGVMHGFDQIGKVSLKKKTQRVSPTPNQEFPNHRRQLTTDVYEGGTIIDEDDIDDILNDPTGPYGEALAMASGRTWDSILAEAADADALTGRKGATTTSLPASQKDITVSAITLARMITCKRVFDANHENKKDRNAMISAHQFEDLLLLDQIRSADYNVVRALVMGEIDTFLGFKFHQTEELFLDTTRTTSRKCIFFQKNSLLLGTHKENILRVGERDDLGYATQLYSKLSGGATRMNETGVYVLESDEA